MLRRRLPIAGIYCRQFVNLPQVRLKFLRILARVIQVPQQSRQSSEVIAHLIFVRKQALAVDQALQQQRHLLLAFQRNGNVDVIEGVLLQVGDVQQD